MWVGFVIGGFELPSRQSTNQGEAEHWVGNSRGILSRGLPLFSPSEVVFLTLPFFSTLKPCLGTVCCEPCFSNPEKSFLFNPSPCFFHPLPCFFHPPPCFFHPPPCCFSPASLLVSPRNFVFLTLNLKQPKPAPHPTQTNPRPALSQTLPTLTPAKI